MSELRERVIAYNAEIKTGIYSAALDGLRGVKLALESAAGGTVSAYGRMGE